MMATKNVQRSMRLRRKDKDRISDISMLSNKYVLTVATLMV